MKKQKSSFISEHRCSIGFFLYLALYNFIIVSRVKPWETKSGGTYMFHIIDYKSLGFRSGLLPGSIYYGIFGEHASVKTASIYESVLILIFFAVVAVLLERFFKRVASEHKTAALFLIFIYLSGPFTFSVFTNTLGMLDAYFLFFTIPFFFLIDNKILKFGIPMLYALCLMSHMSALISCIVLMSILILYRASVEEDEKKKKEFIAVFALSMVLTFGFAFYFMVLAKDMPMPVEEFNKMLEARGGTYLAYLDYTYYDYNVLTGTSLYSADLYSGSVSIWNKVILVFEKMVFLHTEFIRDYMGNSYTLYLRIAASAALVSPVMFFYYRVMGRLFRNTEGNKLKKFCVFLMLVQFPFTILTGYLFSLDINRWFAHAFLISMTMLLYVTYNEEKVREHVFELIDAVRTVPATYVYALAYFLIIFGAFS